MLGTGGNILVQSTSEESEKLSLAIYALSKVASKKVVEQKSRFSDKVDIFCKSILTRDEEFQTDLINDLCHSLGSTDPIVEEFIPQVAEKMGQLWKDDDVSFLDVSFGVDRLQKLLRIYEKRYLGPLYYDFKGPPVLLILPKSETHSLGIITASIIMKKNGVNPFLALGYSEKKLIDLIKSIDFKLFGISASCSVSIDESLQIGETLRKYVNIDIPIVLGSDIGESEKYKQNGKALFSKVTKDPIEAIKLIK